MAGSTNFPSSVDVFATTMPAKLGDDDAQGRTHSENHQDVAAALMAVETRLLTDTGWVTSAKILDGTIATGDIASGAITSALIADGTIVAGDLASNAVTTVKITDANVTAAKLATSSLTIANIAAEAWTSYTPTIGGTGWALGDGTVAGSYAKTLNNGIVFKAKVTFGGTSTFGSGAALTVSLPATALGGLAGYGVSARYVDTSAGTIYNGAAGFSNTTTVTCYATSNANGATGGVLSTAPFTWATTDVVYLTGLYEKA